MSYPAYYIVRCVTGPVFCCSEHMLKLVGIQRFLGAHAHVETIADAGECSNCVNEAKSRKQAEIGREDLNPDGSEPSGHLSQVESK